MPRVFISHSSHDKPFVEKIALDLKKRGIGVWIDKWEIKVGDSLRKRIFEEGIGKSDFVIVVLSESSLQSDWMQKELDSSLSISMRNKKSFVLPLLLDISSKNIPIAFADLRAADFRRGYEHGMKDLLASILGKTQKGFNTVFNLEKSNVISIKEKEPYKLGHLSETGDFKDRDLRLNVRVGVIIDAQGLILTKAVTFDPEDFERYSVDFIDGAQFNNFDCLHVDQSTYTALIKVPHESMSFSRTGNSDTVSVGDEVILIHNHFVGHKDSFKVLRITSEIIDDGKRFLGIGRDFYYAEHDCGCPVFNSSGDLIGILNRPTYYLGGLAGTWEPKILCINDIMSLVANYLHKPYENTKR